MKTVRISVRISEIEKTEILKTGIKTSLFIRQLINANTCNVATVKNS